MDSDLYQEQILDHYKHPRHKEVLVKFDFKHRELNPVCGDDLTFYVKIDKKRKKVIEHISFTGQGCAISQASASLLAEELQGKTMLELEQLNPKNIYSLLGIEISPGRVKCALLCLTTLHKGLKEYQDKRVS